MIRFVTKHIIGMTITVIFMSCYAFCQKNSIINQRVLGQVDCSFFSGSKFEPQIISMPSLKILCIMCSSVIHSLVVWNLNYFSLKLKVVTRNDEYWQILCLHFRLIILNKWYCPYQKRFSNFDLLWTCSWIELGRILTWNANISFLLIMQWIDRKLQ